MGVVILNKENFQATVEQNGIVLVDCWAGWCGPCRMFEPVYVKAAQDHPDHVFAKLNTEEHKDLTGELGVKHIPTLLMYRDGILLLRKPGALDREALDDIIGQAEALDMDAVRAEIAGQQGAAEAE